MSGLLSSTPKVEIKFSGDVWTDVSTYVDLREGLPIQRGRSTEFEDISPATITVVLRNVPDTAGVAPFMPDNPNSPYYPNVIQGKQVRVQVTKSPTTWTRYQGIISEWIPSADTGEPNDMTVTVIATDILSRYARRRVYSQYVESTIYEITNSGAGVLDIWPMDDGENATVLRNIGDAGGYPMRMYESKFGTGAVTLGKPDGNVLLDGAAAFQRSEDAAVGPCALIRLRSGNMNRISGWFRPDVDPVDFDDILVGFNSAGRALWRFGVYSTTGSTTLKWQVRDPDDNIILEYDQLSKSDNAWRYWTILPFFRAGDGTEMIVQWGVRDRYHPDQVLSAAYTPGGIDWRKTRYVSVGGFMDPFAVGSNRNTFMGSVGGLYCVSTDPADGDYFGGSQSAYASPATAITAQERRVQLSQMSTKVDSLISDGPYSDLLSGLSIAMVDQSGSDLLSEWNRFVRTTGTQIVTLRTGGRWLRGIENSRSSTVAATFSAVEDLEGGGVWAKRTRPTRVTATSPVGTVTVVDTAAETLSGQLDEAIDTSAALLSEARNAAAAVIYTGTRVRVTQFTVELSTSQNDIWATCMTLRVGDRVRIDDLPAGVYGASSIDVFVQGWVETYSPDGTVRFTFDCEAADSPGEAVADDATYGRASGEGFMSTGGSLSTTTTTFNVVSLSGAVLTTDATAYPLDLVIDGERMTVASAPASSTSPQSVTVTRAVSPTIARTHLSGAAVDIWLAATAGY